MRERARDKLYSDDTKGANVSSKPVAASTRTTAAPGLKGQIQQAIRSELIARSLAGDMQHRESFEEANDFDVGDDYSPEDDVYSDLDVTPQQANDDDVDNRFARALVGVFESAGIKFPKEEPAAQAPPKEGDARPTPGAPAKDNEPSSD